MSLTTSVVRNNRGELYVYPLGRSVPELVPFTRHHVIGPNGLDSSEPAYIDTLITGVGFMGEEPEKALQLSVRGSGIANRHSEFSSLHLSLLWPNYLELVEPLALPYGAHLRIIGPPRGIVLLVGVTAP